MRVQFTQILSIGVICALSRESGVTDHYAETEQEAFETGRDIVASFNVEPVSSPEGFDEPLYDPAELLGIIPHKDQHTMDMYKVLLRAY